MKFIKLIKIHNEFFNYIYDNQFKISDINDIYRNTTNINISFVLHWKDYLNTDHFTNISNILLRNVIPPEIITMQDMIDNYLTDLIIYSNETSFIDPINKLVRFANVDLYLSPIEYKSYNISTSQEGEFFNDPNYPDLIISVEGLNLNKKLILFNNRIYNTSWVEEKAAVFHDKTVFTYYNKFSFIDLNYAENVQNRLLKDMQSLDYFIIPTSPLDLTNEYDFFVVFMGYPFFIKSKYIKKVDNNIFIDWNYILSCKQFENNTKLEILNHNQTFICFIKCNKLFFRKQHIVKDFNNLYSFDFPNSNLNPGTYICQKDDYTIHDFTIVKPAFKNPLTKEVRPYQVYIDDEETKNGTDPNRNFELMNILIT